MCRTSRSTGWFTLALFFWAGLYSLVACYSVGAQDQPTSQPPSPDTTVSSQPTMPSWDDLDNLSATLSQKASDLVPQVVDLNSQLGQLQRSLLDSTTAFQQSLSMRKQEALAAQAAIRAALNRSLWWQRACLVLAGAGIGYAVDKWPGAAIGAGSGAVVDAGLEISAAIRIKL